MAKLNLKLTFGTWKVAAYVPHHKLEATLNGLMERGYGIVSVMECRAIEDGQTDDHATILALLPPGKKERDPEAVKLTDVRLDSVDLVSTPKCTACGKTMVAADAMHWQCETGTCAYYKVAVHTGVYPMMVASVGDPKPDPGPVEMTPQCPACEAEGTQTPLTDPPAWTCSTPGCHRFGETLD